MRLTYQRRLIDEDLLAGLRLIYADLPRDDKVALIAQIFTCKFELACLFYSWFSRVDALPDAGESEE